MDKSKLSISHHSDGLILSREEFAEADFERPWRYERAHGRLVVMVPPGHEHHVTVASIRDYLGAYKLTHPEIVDFVFQESWAAINGDTDRLPDIAVYLKSTSPVPPIPQRVPELIFEVVSEGSRNRQRDYVEKRGEYQRFGVRESVIVDRFEHKITVLRLVDGTYEETTLSLDETYTTPLLPGLEIPLRNILE